MLKVARKSLANTKLSVHVMPGIATINRDLLPAIDLGVDIFRIGSHCSEADTTSKQIEYLRNSGQSVYGVLMMSHAITPKALSSQAKIMEESGALGVFVMDSAGALRMGDVRDRVSILTSELSIPVGIHAHNNLGLAIANSLVAIEEGATMLDGCAAGFGAGAGNAQMEVIISLLREQSKTDADATGYLKAAETALNLFIPGPQTLEPLSVATGLAGLFSGFLKPILRESKINNIDAFKLIEELKQYNLFAGQEDKIIEIARGLRKKE
jgi:4-hydroxy 2-oxovalerate aldolase